MKSHITPERIANSVLQDKSFQGYYVFVEGNNDFKLYSNFFLKDSVRVEISFGWEQVKEVLEILDDRDYKKKLGIIDRDFRNIVKYEKINRSDLFITDYHDIEVTTLYSSAYDSVLNICNKNDEIRKIERDKNKSIKDLIIELSQKVGYIKLANRIKNLGLVFKPKGYSKKPNYIKYDNFICTKTFNYFGDEKLIETVINYSNNKSTDIKSKEEVEKALNEIKENKYCPKQLINGHDVSSIFFMIIKKALKVENKLFTNFESVEDSLILAYSYEEFKTTQLYKTIYSWQAQEKVKLLK